jgi:hypothetical protein
MANTGQTGPRTKRGKEIVTKNLPRGDAWQLSEEGRKAKELAGHLSNLRHGFYATIPIRCKADECPYADVCPIFKMGKAPYGEVCPVEAATVEELTKRYIKEFDVNEEDMVDVSMIRNLVDIDISILRCNKKLAIDADIVQDVIVGITEQGQAITQPQINKAYDLQERLLNRREKILTLMQGTRKDKVQAGQAANLDPSTIIADMKAQLDKFREEKENTIDITPEEVVD